MLRFFRKKKADGLDEDFNHLYRDLTWVKHWINHINQKSNNIHKSNSYKHEITQKELSRLKNIIIDISKNMHKIERVIKEMVRYSIENNEFQKKMHKRLLDVENSLRDRSGTSQGQVLQKRTIREVKKDMSLNNKEIKRTSQGHVLQPEETGKEKNQNLKATHKNVLDLLEKTEEPIEYSTVSRVLGIKEKTLRNAVYELRQKGYKIESRRTGFRKKGLVLVRKKDMSLQVEGQVRDN